MSGLAVACSLAAVAWFAPTSVRGDTPPLTINQNHFVASDGTPVRFWGMNLVAMYPTHTQAQGIAAGLAAREINLVRLHHNLRSSTDWNTVSGIAALVTYVNDSRTLNPDAWDRFDYLNSQLRDRGIYVLLSLHSSRRFLAGDVDILTTDSTDRTNWMNAMTALNSMPSNLDLFKVLPMIDERCAELMEEFAQRLVTHVNPYTGTAYGSDPQVLYLETMNEHSCEYAIVAGNKFQSTTYPAVSYFTTELQAKWDAFTAANGVTSCDIYAPSTTAQKLARGDFLRGLDQAYATRMRNFVRNLGSQAPMGYSNLWRGEAFQKFEESASDVVEEHGYVDPLIPRTFDDAFNYFSRSTPVGKPYFVGEFNESTVDSSITANAVYRGAMQLAASAYGTFNDWSGVTWFAWAHGDKLLSVDGGPIWEQRRPSVNNDIIGYISGDGAMLDHLRTAGLMFKRGLVAPSAQPKTLYADDPLSTTGYTQLMAPKYQFQVGWQNIFSIKRAFGPVPASQPTAPWMTTAPTNPLVSDTGEIQKDTTRQQLTVSAAQAEAFSGKLDAQPPAGITHIGIGAASGSATVILVSNDGQPLTSSNSLVISRTYYDASNNEVANPITTLAGLQPAGTGVWQIKRTRPVGETGYEPVMDNNGVLQLPSDGWHEAELVYAPAGSLPARQSTQQVGDVYRPVFDDAFRMVSALTPAQGGIIRNAQGVIDPSTAAVPPAQGVKSLRMKFTAGFDPCVLGWNFTNSISQVTPLDLTALKNTHGLQFWIYPKRLVSSFSVELACDNGTQLVEVRVPLSRYLAPSDYTTKWVQVTVPFSDFPATDASGNAFLWDRVKAVGFYCSTVTDGFYDPQADYIRIARVALPPTAPSNLTATAGNGQITLSWSAVSGASGYNVKRATASDASYANIETTTDVRFADNGVANGTMYHYEVSAVNATGEGIVSAPVSATPFASMPPAITSDSTANGTFGAAFTYAIAATGSPTTYSATGLPAGLAIDPNGGVISGVPGAAGSFAVTLGAMNAGGTATATLTLVIAKANALVTLGDLAATYDGSPKQPSATTDPAGLNVVMTYDGGSLPPTNAGGYSVTAAIDDPNYAGSASGTLQIAKAPATVALGNLDATYDGAAKATSVTTSPSRLAVQLTYNGGSAAPVNAGTYAIFAAITDPNYFGSAAGVLTVEKATATVTLAGLKQRYDGTPRSVTPASVPGGLSLNVTYGTGGGAPVYPGAYPVTASIDDPNYVGTANGTLVVDTTITVRHAPMLDGQVEGSLQMMLPEGAILNGDATVSGDLLAPGLPTVQLNGTPTYAGTTDAAGSDSPSGYVVTLNGYAVLRHVVRRVDAVDLPQVAAPPMPTGTRTVVLNDASQSPGDFGTLRDLTINGGVGTISVPPGTYGTFMVNGGDTLVFGVSGASEPAAYNLQGLTLNGTAAIQVVAPVVLTVAQGMTTNGIVGDATQPGWLTLQIASGGLTLNTGAGVYGSVIAPTGTVMVNSGSIVQGGVVSDRLTINSGGQVKDP